MATAALIYIQPGRVPDHKQTASCLRYAVVMGWRASIVRPGALAEALRLIREGQAHVLLLAYRDPQTVAEIEESVQAAGGRVEYCGGSDRPTRRQPLGGPEAEKIALRMHELGGSTDEIARLCKIPVQRLRDLLRRRQPE